MAELSYLPPEIVTNIFARLPMETLSNVILVNKFCLHLISSSDFTRLHLQHSKKQGQTNRSGCRVIFPTSGKFFKQVSFESLLSLSVNVVDLDIFKIGSWKQNLCVVGSCDGLVCIVLEYTLLLLWNPCTGKYKILPRFSLHLDDYNERHFGISYGFGYDESTDDYKVVALSSSRRRSTETYRNLVNIFSLKRESWKTAMLSGFGLCVEGVDMGKLASGKLHWYLYDAKNWRWDIVSFDLGSEVFGRVELPSNDEDDGFEVSFNVLDGFICLLRSYGPEQQNLLDLLLWKEYGVKESWRKIAIVSCVEVLNDFELCSMLPNGEILFYSCKCFAVYNPKDDSFRLPSMTRLNFTAEPVVYVQSLVSPVV